MKPNFDLQKRISHFPFFDSDFEKIYNSAALSFASSTIAIENVTLSFPAWEKSRSPELPCVPQVQQPPCWMSSFHPVAGTNFESPMTCC